MRRPRLVLAVVLLVACALPACGGRGTPLAVNVHKGRTNALRAEASDDAPVPGTCLRERTCMSAREVADMFDITRLHDAGLRGQGETVAIIMAADVSKDDIKKFDAEMGITDELKFDTINVATIKTPTKSVLGEAAMDVETVRMIAPAAQILLYTAPLEAFGVALERIIADKRAQIASYSAGVCEATLAKLDGGADLRKSLADALVHAAAENPPINVFVSSGDHGVYGCHESKFPSWDVSTDYPSSSSLAISVGGTFVERTADGKYLDEAAWASPFTNWATGGGIDSAEPLPTWQKRPGVQNAFSNGRRQAPDVSGPGADPLSSWPIVVQGVEEAASGTSATAPFWAGLAALYQQLVNKEHVGPLGPLNPMLYAIAAARPPNTVFHDIVRGNNLGYDATPGWDYATGLGTPVGYALGQAIVKYRRAHRAS